MKSFKMRTSHITIQGIGLYTRWGAGFLVLKVLLLIIPLQDQKRQKRVSHRESCCKKTPWAPVTWLGRHAYLLLEIGFCTLCFCFATKMLHLNAPFFPLKCWVSPKKSLKCSDNAHLIYKRFFKLISKFTLTKTCKCCKTLQVTTTMGTSSWIQPKKQLY